jgi:hypothetical protein
VKHYIESLKQIFLTAPNKHEANDRSRAVLEDMSCDSGFFTSVLEKHLQTAGSLNTKHYPVVGIDIELNHLFGLVANCWIPLPDRATNVSTKAIHTTAICCFLPLPLSAQVMNIGLLKGLWL